MPQPAHPDTLQVRPCKLAVAIPGDTTVGLHRLRHAIMKMVPAAKAR